MSDMIRQIDRYLDDDLNDEELAELLAWVGADEANADLFARQTLLDQHASELLQDGEFQLNVESVPSQANGYSRRRLVWITAALATVALLLVAVLQPGGDRQTDRPENAIATIAYESHARLSDRDCSQGDVIGKGLLELKVGIVRLDFANGAMVTLQGPARFEIISEEKTRLESGILTASIPQSAVGFEVITPAVGVVDLGTALPSRTS